MSKTVVAILLVFALCGGCGLSKEKRAELGAHLAHYEGCKGLYVKPHQKASRISTDVVNLQGRVKRMGDLCFKVPEEWKTSEVIVEKQRLIFDGGSSKERGVHHVTFRHPESERVVEATWVPSYDEFPWEGHAKRVYMDADQFRQYCGGVWGFVVKYLEVTPDDVATTGRFLERDTANQAKLALLSNKYLVLKINDIQPVRIERIACDELKAIAVWGTTTKDKQEFQAAMLELANRGGYMGSLFFRAKVELSQEELRSLVADVLATTVVG